MHFDRSLINEPPTLNGDVYKWFEDFPVHMRHDYLTPHNFKLHVQPGIELNLTLEGQGTFVVDNNILRQSPGQLLMFPGKLPHQVFVDPSGSYNRLVVLIDDKKLSSLLPNEQFYRLSDIPYQQLYLQPETYMQVRQLLFEMHEEMQERQTGWQQVVLSGLLKLAVMIRRIADSQEQGGQIIKRLQSEDVISRICSYISGHLQEDLSLRKMAQSFHISPDHLIRTFKKEKGMTFHKYVLLQRVIESKRLLIQQPEMNLTDIAFTAGFSSPSQFSKTFKNFVGQTPSQYREKAMEAGAQQTISRIH